MSTPQEAAAALQKAMQDNIDHMADLGKQFQVLQANFQRLVTALPQPAPFSPVALQEFQAKQAQLEKMKADMDAAKADLDARAKALFVFPPLPH